MIRCLRRAAVLSVVLLTAAASAQGRFFSSNGVAIHYVDRGTGEPVVLVHGQGGTLQDWIDSGVLQSLATDHRVIALDCRGHGKSGKPHDARHYGREMAFDVVRLLDHLGIPKAHLVGYSMGAQIAAQLLALYPHRFLTATLGGAAGRFRRTTRTEQLEEQIASEIEQHGVSGTLISLLTPSNQPKPTEEELKKLSDAALADADQDRHALAALVRSRRDQVITPAQAAAVTVRTLGLAGREDPALADLQELKKLRPTLKIVVIDGASHGDAMTRPEFAAAIRAFISAEGLTPAR